MFNKKIDTQKLYKEFIGSDKLKKKEEILKTLIKYEAEEEIIDIIKSGKYNKEDKYYILIFLVETNFNYEKLKPILNVLNIRNDGVEEFFQNKIVRKLHNSNNEEELFFILNNYKYFSESNKDAIYNFIMIKNSSIEKRKSVFNRFDSVYQKKVITSLIEKNEIKEIESNYLNIGFNSSIINFLLTSKKDNIKQIKKLYNKITESKNKEDAKSKDVLVEKLVDIVLKSKKIDIEEILFLFEKCRDQKRRNKIIDKIIELENHESLVDILASSNSTKENKDQISSYIIKNSNNFKVLKDLFTKCTLKYKNDIINKLVELNEFKELENNYLNTGYDKKIFILLINNKQNDSKALINLYSKDTNVENKDLIISMLLDLNAIDDLSKILLGNDCSNENKILIMSYIVEESIDYKLLKSVFEIGNDSFKLRVIDQLIDKNAGKELEKNYFNMGYDERIIKLLLRNGDFNKSSLKLFYTKSKDSKSRDIIIASLIKLKSSKELLDILINQKCSVENKSNIIIYFIDQSSDLLFLRKIFNVSNKSFKEMIVEKLLNINAIEELIKNYLNIGYNTDIIKKFIALDMDVNAERLMSIYSNVTDIESKNAIINKLVSIKAIPELKDIYKNSKNKMELFPKLISLSIFPDIEIISFIARNIEEKVKKSDTFLNVILSYLEFLSGIKNPLFIHKILNSNFLYFFNEGLNKNKDYYLVLCSFINIKKFKREVVKIKDNFVVTDDIEKNRTEIKEKYSVLMGSAKYKNEIEKILKKRDKELSKLFTSDRFNVFIKISEMYYTKESKNSNNIKYDGDSVSTEKLLSDIKIIEDLEKEETKITKSLIKKISNLVDSSEIMKVKLEAEKDKGLLISKNNFCYTIQNFDKTQIENYELIHKLGEILVTSKDIEIQKVILELSYKTDKRLWLIYIHRISNSKELIGDIYKTIKKKFFLGNFSFVLNRKELWDEPRYKMLILEHIFYFIFNLTKNDIPELLNLLKIDLDSFPKNMKSKVKNTFMNIIENKK